MVRCFYTGFIGFLAILITLSISSCNREHENSYEIIDFEKAIHNSEAFDIKKHVSSIRYIPLETKEECFIGEIRKIVKNEDYFLISDFDGNLFQFTSTGQFIRRIGVIGKGPGEYLYMTDFVVDVSYKNIYINSLGYLYNYDVEGNFKTRLPLNFGNLQVLCMDSQNRLFYIMPDAKQANGKTSFDIVLVYDLDGQLLKTIQSSTVRTKGLAIFNSIYEKDNEVFYKEEFGKSIFRIKSDLNIDTAFFLDLGKYAFEPEDLNMSKKDTWEDHYRLYNMFSFERFVFLNMQKGLIGASTEAVIYDRKKQDLIYPQNMDDSSEKGIYLDGAELTPVSDFNNELICVISIEDILDNGDILSGDLKSVSSQINDNSNPVLAILEVK
jgi:6-bladed beta-propeller